MFFKDSPLTLKITGLVLFSAVAPLLLFYLFGIQQFLHVMEKALARELTIKASLVAKDIDRFVAQRVTDTKVLARSGILNQADTEQVTLYLQGVLNENPWINEIDLLDLDGRLTAHTGAASDERSFAWENYPELKPYWDSPQYYGGKDVFVTETPRLDNGQGAGLLFLTAVANPSGGQGARLLLVELGLKDIQSIIVDFRNAIASTKHVYLVKNDGRVMVTDDPDVVPFQIFPDIERYPNMRAFFAVAGAEGDFQYTDSKNELIAAGFADLSEFGANRGLDWSILATAAKRQVVEPVYNSGRALMILGLLLSGVMTVIAYVLSRRITKPLTRTMEAVRNLKEGNYACRVLPAGARETRYLAAAVNDMADQIEQKTDELVKSNAGLEAEIEVRRSAERAIIESDNLKKEFIATASHELRTPLTAVIGYSELMIENDSFSEEQKADFLQCIYTKALALDQIVDELLDVSRLESGRLISIERAPLKIVEIVRLVVQQTQGAAHPCRIVTFFEDEELELFADRGKMFQVFENLLGNAIKFSPEGGLIEVRGEQLDGHYRITVADEGIGMSAEQQELVFDKFYRANTADKAIQGLGIGLYLVKKIIELHQGQIWSESRIGKGSRFICTLPLKNSEP